MLAGETPEVIMERIDPPDANPRARVPAEAQASSQQQQQQQVPHSQGVNMGETHYRLFGMAAPPPTTPGPQSVRSDHSSGSMATEYSTTTVGDPATRVLHVFGPSMPGTQTQSIDSLFQQLLTRTGNPFSTASVFLGAEPGHAAHSSRRTSTSSSANSGVRPGSDAGTGAPGNAGARARGLPEEPARSAAAVPRTGNTRTRTLSSSSNGADAGVGSRGSVAGSSKRHRANDADGRPGEGPA
ncbi:hypothetical protein LPJ61_002068 [Coemansia biformis]|uniref:Uncharacterized protein n=1 Tax=Coemansia biformis TaxID=1286918 RepID=A0A9W8CXJ4_9FUNG|nr:hypothetical protein LPJ61_002068 [Coemansia biformis]